MSCDCGNFESAEPTPKSDETHGEYMTRCQDAGYSREECMAAHEGHTFKEAYYDDEKKKKAAYKECEDCETAEHCAEKGSCQKGYSSSEGDCGCGCKGAVVAYEEWDEENVEAAEYQGRKVTLNKPFRTKGAAKKFGVYTKNGSGTVVIVRFGDPNMEIKRDDPARRKSFRSRHNCSNPGPKWKARYWSCRQWRSGKKVEAKDADDPCTDGYEQYGMKTKNGRKVPNCVPIKKAESCGYGEKMIDGECQKVSVFIDLDIDSLDHHVEASTGKSIIRISGVAFHKGINKNSWGLTYEGAKATLSQFEGLDLTLLHPSAGPGGFKRNMNGGVEEAIVGVVIKASIMGDEEDWKVKFIAEVHRTELFEALESGMWLRENYGVSIGGTGKPAKVVSHEDGKKEMWFDAGFKLDHLAIVHKPAYPGARIESVKRINVAESQKPMNKGEEFISSMSLSSTQQQVTAMNTEDNVSDVEDVNSTAQEMEELRAQLILANAIVDEFHAKEAASAEESRMELVSKASELGMKGHDDLNTETLEGLIASWVNAHPEPVATEMKPVEASTSVGIDAPSMKTESVVSNYLNGEKLDTPESAYAAAWNMWAKNWNGCMAGDEMSAPSYEEAKQRRLI